MTYQERIAAIDAAAAEYGRCMQAEANILSELSTAVRDCLRSIEELEETVAAQRRGIDALAEQMDDKADEQEGQTL
jgi:soluble cytochrome b562